MITSLRMQKNIKMRLQIKRVMEIINRMGLGMIKRIELM
mgnify:CR=1 FL=1